jgi:hypothetical protein
LRRVGSCERPEVATEHLPPVHSHFFLLILFALFVSIVFAALMRDDARSQVQFGAVMFASFVAGAVVLGWLMYPFPL